MATGEQFGNFKYQSDAGGIYKIRMSVDSFAVAGNTEPAGAYTDKRVKVDVGNAGRKRISGLHARAIVLGLPTAVGASTYASRTKVPVLTNAGFAGFVVGALVTYQTGQWEILDKIGEA